MTRGWNGIGIQTKQRKAARTAVITALKTAPRERLKELFEPHLDEYAEVVIRGMKNGNRTELNLYADALDLAGMQLDTAIALLAARGISGESELDKLVSRQREAEGINEAQLWRLAEGFANDYRKRHGMPLLVEGRPVKESA